MWTRLAKRRVINCVGDEGDEEESDKIVHQVLDELGIEMADQLGGLPVGTGSLATGEKAGKPKVAAAAAGGPGPSNAGGTTPAAGADTEDLEARLDALRRGGNQD
jgi:charged multivesicular body protein 2A